MAKLFGTDGVRGRAGRFPLDEATVRVIGRSLSGILLEQRGSAPEIVTGRDTRESGAWVERALLEGARERGATVRSAGVITTPGVAYLARTLNADAGVVVSASHNPFQDNGIKIFAPTGRKLDDSLERRIEADIESEAAGSEGEASAAGAASSSEEPDSHQSMELRERYLDYLAEEVAGGLSLDGMSVALDCANGASFELAPALFKRLGARVSVINAEPDGQNINLNCGSQHMEGLRRKVMDEGAELGVAFDGDADRALFVNARGEVVDGDAVMWAMARVMSERGELKGGAVVATVMSNIGLEIALRSKGLALTRTDVGDKYVLEELLRSGASLGGEQSGHIIFPQQSLVGDGMVTTINLLRAMKESGLALEELTRGFERYPQVLVNVPVREKRPFEEVEPIREASRRVEAQLGSRGRLLLRYSGTEALARVMIEGERQEEIEALARQLAEAIRAELGAA
ncbi:MAG TPA: phosphoglucosamine mutase [Pyrinomonadaceae bacterium]|nr:phosphoglucosamine mutase [Pyrinomonadaceae bacterium]